MGGGKKNKKKKHASSHIRSSVLLIHTHANGLDSADLAPSDPNSDFSREISVNDAGELDS